MNSEFSTFLTSDFELNLYHAALRNLADEDNKLRLNNFSYAMRELVRHVLNRLAPDSEVQQCVWYKEEAEKPGVVNRRQRAYFSVQGGLSDDYIKKTLGIEVDEIHSCLIHAVNNLSKFTHIEPSTFNLPKSEVELHVSQTLEAMTNLFLTIYDCRAKITECLWEHIDQSIINEALESTLRTIDEITTHYCIEEVSINEVEIAAIDHNWIHFIATGKISCELQWGSNSDLRRGDGAVLSDSYPFTCHLYSPVDDPSAIKGHEDAMLIDSRSWWENDYNEA